MERLSNFFQPKHYRIVLAIDKNQQSLQGYEEIRGKVGKAGLIKLHSVGQEIAWLKLDGAAKAFSLSEGTLSLESPEKAGQDVSLELGFKGKLNQNMQGAYLSSYKIGANEERIVSTQFESHYAREAFPCVDEPAAKASFELEIVTPETGDEVWSNMPVAKRSTVSASELAQKLGRAPAELSEQSYCSWSFEKTPKMSTYLLAFVIGKFNAVEGETKSGIKVRTLAPLDQDKALLEFPNQVAIRALEFYEELFGAAYPLAKLDQVAIPDFEAGAMENWGLVTYRCSQLLCADKSALASKKAVSLTVTHELSHQWFGNLVTMEWWNDLWLNESFATIMEYLCTDALFPEYQVWTDFFTGDCYAALRRDAVRGVQAVQEEVNDPAEIATLFDPCIVYAKGARLMLMLMREMGETGFFKGVRQYFKDNAYKNTAAADLWRALNPYAEFDVSEFMTAWLTQPGYPVVTDEAQQRFLFDGSTDDSKYPIPELRDDMSGHYLINLSGPEFAEALEQFPTLSEEQKLRILIDRLLLSRTPIVSSASLLPILAKFRQEKAAPLWEILSSIIARIKIFLEPDSPEETKFKAYLAGIVSPLIKELGLEPKEHEDSNTIELRSTLLSLASYAHAVGIEQKLAQKYDSALAAVAATTEENKTLAALQQLDPELRPYVSYAKLWLAEAETYPELMAAYLQISDPELKDDLLSALARPRRAENIEQAFQLLSDPERLKPQDHLTFLFRLRAWPATRERALTWVFAHWDYIEKVCGEKSLEDYPRYLASTIYKAEEAQAFWDFFLQFADKPVLARTLKIARNDMQATLDLIKLDQTGVLRALKQITLEER